MNYIYSQFPQEPAHKPSTPSKTNFKTKTSSKRSATTTSTQEILLQILQNPIALVTLPCKIICFIISAVRHHRVMPISLPPSKINLTGWGTWYSKEGRFLFPRQKCLNMFRNPKFCFASLIWLDFTIIRASQHQWPCIFFNLRRINCNLSRLGAQPHRCASSV